jgi:hypothetical protein
MVLVEPPAAQCDTIIWKIRVLDVTLSRVTQSGDPSPGMLRYAHTWTGMRIPGSHRGICACIPDEVSATRVDRARAHGGPRGQSPVGHSTSRRYEIEIRRVSQRYGFDDSRFLEIWT